MQEVFSKIIEKLEELKKAEIERDDSCDEEGYGDGEEIYEDGKSAGRYEQTVRIIKIVKQEAEKFGTDTNVGSNGWIPVEEELPKTDEYILLSFSNFSIPLVGRYEEDENGGAFYVGDETEPCVKQGIFVNAWMHLPSLYQPKGE